jgi:hypothetical protein
MGTFRFQPAEPTCLIDNSNYQSGFSFNGSSDQIRFQFNEKEQFQSPVKATLKQKTDLPAMRLIGYSLIS